MAQTADGKADPDPRWTALRDKASAARAVHGNLDLCWIRPEDDPDGEHFWRPSGSDQGWHPKPPRNLAKTHSAFSDFLDFAAEAGRYLDSDAADPAGAWLTMLLRRWPSDGAGIVGLDFHGNGIAVRFETGSLMDAWGLGEELCAELSGARTSFWAAAMGVPRPDPRDLPSRSRGRRPSAPEQAAYDSLLSQAKPIKEWRKLDFQRRASSQNPGPLADANYPKMIEDPRTRERVRVATPEQQTVQLAKWGTTAEEAEWAAAGRRGHQPKPEQPLGSSKAGSIPRRSGRGRPPKITADSKAEADAVTRRAAERQGVVMPILKEKRWTRGKLVTEVGVGKGTVYGYLDGTRAWMDKDSRTAIAQVLGLDVDKLPV